MASDGIEQRMQERKMLIFPLWFTKKNTLKWLEMENQYLEIEVIREKKAY